MVVGTWGDLVRPVLRDGLHVVRRDDRHLQVGLDPPDVPRLLFAEENESRAAATKVGGLPGILG